MDRLIVDVGRREGKLLLRLLTIPALDIEMVTVKDYQPDSPVQVHISSEKILVEYINRYGVSFLRVFLWRDKLTCCEVSSEPLQSSRHLQDLYSPFALYGSLASRLPNQAKTYITYNRLLYVMDHLDWNLYGGSDQRLQLSIRTVAGEQVANYEAYLTNERKQWLPSSARSAGPIKGYGAYITPWFVLIFEKDSQQVSLWRYETSSEIQTFTLNHIVLRSYTAQRSTDTAAVFLDEAKRLVLISQTSIQVFTMRYFDLRPLLYTHSHGHLRLPKAVLQDLALLYLAGKAD